MPDRTCLIGYGCSTSGIFRGDYCGKHYQRWRKWGDPLFVKNVYGDDTARFWSKVDKNGPVPERRPDLGPCWTWTGDVERKGYGRITIAGTAVPATRFLCGLEGVAIPDGHEPDHLCKNTNCVNLAHLEIVPKRVNILRSDNPAAINARKTHCKRGHEFTPDNTTLRVRPDGRVRRECRACFRDAGRRHREKVRALKAA